LLQNGIHGKSTQLAAMKSEIDRLRSELESKLRSGIFYFVTFAL
jgi:hypothetical protein